MKENEKQKVDMQKLAETGWLQMHETLREQGLSSDETVLSTSGRKRNFILLMAACLLLMLVISYPFISNNHSYFSFNSKNRHIDSKSKTENPAIIKSENSIAAENKNDSNNISSYALTTDQKISLHKKLIAKISEIEKENFMADWQLKRTLLLQKFSSERKSIAVPASDQPIDTSVNVQRVIYQLKLKEQKKIKVFAGAGMNLSTGKSSFNLDDVNLHPGMTIIIPISSKFTLHTGLSALSTIHGKEVSTREKELQNSFSPNIYYNINTTSIIKASYFDVPVTLHYSINKNWSVGSGLQLSKLYKVNIKEQKQSFDYNNTLYAASVQQINATPARAAATFQKKLEVRKFETRFVAETNYQTGKFLLSAGYYYGLGKTISLKDAMNSDHQYRNVYFKFGVQYRIR
ncbi:MAG: outer membrane beta-barrel protein [Ginsengibacter sp.]